MTYKQIEQARELRLWLGQVVIPAATIVGVAMTKPEVREAVVKKTKAAKDYLKAKFHK